MKAKKDQALVSVTKLIYYSNCSDYLPVMYDIEVGESSIMGITEESMNMLYHKLGECLLNEKGGTE